MSKATRDKSIATR